MKPPLRIIHHLSKSGGTIISRCLGCMQDIILLSEVHPLNSEVNRYPLQQAYCWFNLLTTEEIQAINPEGSISFADSIKLIYQKGQEKNQTLVLRDWNHLDFFGIPYTAPTHILSTNQALQKQFHLLEVATVRHPIDEWYSMQRLPDLRHISLEDYLTGYLNFIESCHGMTFIHYEDFACFPEKTMQTICQILDINYDADFIQNWVNYKTITGSSKELHKVTKIILKSYPRNPEILGLFQANKNYQEIVAFLKYDPELA
ncbi:MAG: hypothetical protein EAZ18_03895 [Oscillatoriales cyanobacterium]|jgi:hypothetical protein|nr:MAG: hypothetical protein EAZ18_03895 [Oscillatoriales cyanobacterium]